MTDPKPQEKTEEKNTTNNKSMLEAIEDDDDFEEFEQANWANGETEDETQQWMENWDDADVDGDDFTKMLRAELTKQASK